MEPQVPLWTFVVVLAAVPGAALLGIFGSWCVEWFLTRQDARRDRKS